MDNPEKIPLLPIEELETSTPYTATSEDRTTPKEKTSAWKSFGKTKMIDASSQIPLSSKQKFLLSMLIVLLTLIAVIAGWWLFQTQVDLGELL